MAENAIFYMILILSTNICQFQTLMQETTSSVEFLPQRIEIQTPRHFEPSSKKGVSIAAMTQRTETMEFLPQQVQLTEFNHGSHRTPRRFVSTAQSTVAQSTVQPVLVQDPQLVANPLFSAAIDYKPLHPQLAYQTFSPPQDLQTLTSAVRSNPVLTALLLSTLLGNRNSPVGYNSQHPAPDPLLSLLLSHYGRYIPRPGRYDGLYGYNAANNIHNTRPFGSYKIYDDSS